MSETRRQQLSHFWAGLWPKLAALAIALGLWQLVFLSGWRTPYVLPSPATVLGRLGEEVASGAAVEAAAITLRRALGGYAIAVVLGTALGLAVARWSVVRRGVSSLLTGLQTMPSVAWFPLAILLFQLSESAILFVVVLGAAPSIAIGLLSATAQVPPTLIRAGKVLGARGFALYRHVIIPAALPGFIGGLKQGWAFAWRSLMAGELLVIIGNAPSLGVQLQFAREFSDAPALLAWMLVVLLIGIAVDAWFFSAIEARVRAKRGLV